MAVMIKRILLTLLEFIVFIVLLAVGGNWDAINLNLEMQQLQKGQVPHVFMQTIKYPIGSHILIANGLIFATALLVLILLFLLLRKKLHPWASLAVLAYVLAVCLAMAMKLGLPPADTPSQSEVSMPWQTQDMHG